MRSLTLLLTLSLTLLVSSGPACAHKTRVQRKALVTIRAVDGGISPELMAWMRIGGSRAKRFLSRFDLNQDGVLGPGESSQLGDALGAEALGGIFLSLNNVALSPLKAISKARRVSADLIEVAVLLSYGKSPLGAGHFTLGARPGQDRPGVHPHVGEIGALAPLWLLSSGTRSRRLTAKKITPKAPWNVSIIKNGAQNLEPILAP